MNCAYFTFCACVSSPHKRSHITLHTLIKRHRNLHSTPRYPHLNKPIHMLRFNQNKRNIFDHFSFRRVRYECAKETPQLETVLPVWSEPAAHRERLNDSNSSARYPLRPCGTHANAKFSCMRHQYLRFRTDCRRLAAPPSSWGARRAPLPHTRCFHTKELNCGPVAVPHSYNSVVLWSDLFPHAIASFIRIFVIKSHGLHHNCGARTIVWFALRERRLSFRCFLFLFRLIQLNPLWVVFFVSVRFVFNHVHQMVIILFICGKWHGDDISDNNKLIWKHFAENAHPKRTLASLLGVSLWN